MSKSLEALKHIKEGLYDYALNQSYKECIEKIEKDLEVLETLRPHLINAGIGKFDNVEDNEVFHLKLNLWGKEYNKLEEWLKDE